MPQLGVERSPLGGQSNAQSTGTQPSIGLTVVAVPINRGLLASRPVSTECACLIVVDHNQGDRGSTGEGGCAIDCTPGCAQVKTEQVTTNCLVVKPQRVHTERIGLVVVSHNQDTSSALRADSWPADLWRHLDRH